MASEDSYKSWAQAPGTTEQTKCDNAVAAIKKAIDASNSLKQRSIKVFPQGSYANRTNVRQESDVDVCILCYDTFFFELPTGKSAIDYGISTPENYTYVEYKNDVEKALKDYFGAHSVTRGKKAFDIRENSYRVESDAVATFEHRRYWDNGTYLSGAEFRPDDGGRVINWPDQNYANGVSKNKDTGGKFKDLVRIIKRLKVKMSEEKISAADPIPSFLIESLIWNVPNSNFGYYSYSQIVRESLAHLFNKTIKVEDCIEWGEVNELKYLFRGQAWTIEQTHKFLSAAWNYLELE